MRPPHGGLAPQDDVRAEPGGTIVVPRRFPYSRIVHVAKEVRMRKLSQKLSLSAALLTATATLASAQILRAPTAIDSGTPALFLRVHHETDAAAAGPAKILSTVPESWTVSDWAKQNVYDLADNK